MIGWQLDLINIKSTTNFLIIRLIEYCSSLANVLTLQQIPDIIKVDLFDLCFWSLKWWKSKINQVFHYLAWQHDLGIFSKWWRVWRRCLASHCVHDVIIWPLNLPTGFINTGSGEQGPMPCVRLFHPGLVWGY